MWNGPVFGGLSAEWRISRYSPEAFSLVQRFFQIK
jgi:hypothetical protein